MLFKNATALETSAHIDTMVMDKTGTLTKGEPEVTNVVADGLSEDQLLALAAAVERESEHPLAQAVTRRADEAGVTNLSPGRSATFPAMEHKRRLTASECSSATTG